MAILDAILEFSMVDYNNALRQKVWRHLCVQGLHRRSK